MPTIPGWIQADLRRKTPDDGESVLEVYVCELCGSSWQKGKRKPYSPHEPTGVLAIPRGDELCPTCATIAMTTPTVYAWVKQTIGFQQSLEQLGNFDMATVDHDIKEGSMLAKALPGYGTYDTSDLTAPEAKGFALMNGTAAKDGKPIEAHVLVKAAKAACREIVSDG